MLSLEKFTDKLGDLMAWYVNFNFGDLYFEHGNDLVPTLRTQKWYEAFKNFDDDDFEMMVEEYMRENVYPPSSPSSILEYANKKIIEQHKMDVEKAWQELKKGIKLHGFKSYRAWSEEKQDYVIKYMLDLSIKKSGDDILYKVFQEMYSELQSMNSNNEQWVRKAFFERYNELLVQKAKDSTKVGKIALQSDKKMLE